VLLMNNNTTLESSSRHRAFTGHLDARPTPANDQSTRPRTEIDGYMVGLAAKALLAPIAIGVLFGIWMDNLLSQELDWTFAFAVIGFIVGSFNMRYRMIREKAMLLEEQDIDD